MSLEQMQTSKSADYIYDIETYPNVFTMVAKCTRTSYYWIFEISEHTNQLDDLVNFLYTLHKSNARMVGFNNLNFDYPAIHAIMEGEARTYYEIYQKAQAQINSTEQFKSIPHWSEHVTQIDLFKIHHFDNKARSTSLKALQFAMRTQSLEDLPFKPGTAIPLDQIPNLIKYNIHDVDETHNFYELSLPAIKLREELSERYDENFLNANDTRIGKQIFIQALEKAKPGCCYDSYRNPIQTWRPTINLADCIFPYVRFNHPEFQRIHSYLMQRTITETKNAFKATCNVGGLEFHFGTGGIHASVNNKIYQATDERVIIDLDVTSYYPSLAIANQVYPEHLGVTFCEQYAALKAERVKHEKGSPVNAALKLALNGVYGDSNNPYSPFYDPQYTMTITLNGQLLLCMLAEWLLTIPTLELIQVNTDGLTVAVNINQASMVDSCRKAWEQYTQLELEEAHYSRMWIRDVNNYIAEYENGKTKCKGAYDTNKQWHQDTSQLICAIAAYNEMVNGTPIEATVYSHKDLFDFMIRAKVPRNCRLLWGNDEIQQTSRVYVATLGCGKPLTKVMPPLKSKERTVTTLQHPVTKHVMELDKEEDIEVATKRYYQTVKQEVVPGPERHIGICAGHEVKLANVMPHTLTDINYNYYINEAKKLIIC